MIVLKGRQLITCMYTKTALNGFKVDFRAPGPVRSPQMALMLLGLHGARLSRKWSFLDFRVFLHDFTMHANTRKHGEIRILVGFAPLDLM